MTGRTKLSVAALAFVALAIGAVAGPTVIYSTIQTSDTSLVPGLGGVRFDTGTAAFSRPYRSQNGQYWLMNANLNIATTADDEVIVRGSSATGAVVVREGQTATWDGAGRPVGPIDERMSVNNLGEYVFATDVVGGATTDDEQIVAYRGGAFGLVAREGGAVPGVAGEAYGTSLNSASITNSSKVGFHAPATVGVVPATGDEFLILDDTVQAQAGVAGTPAGQAGAPQTWNTFNADDFYVNAAGTKWLAQGTLTGATASNNVVVVDNGVVLQEGQSYPGLDNPLINGTGTTSPIDEAIMTPEGDWMVRGRTSNSEEDFFMLNGTVIAKNNELVPGGLPGERFSDNLFANTFFTMASNSLGDFVYGGTTDNADPEFDAVVVLNDLQVILRQGDAVDVDGNGLFDDDAFIDVFNNEDMFLTDDLWLYFTAVLRNGASDTLGQAFIRVQVPEPATLSLLALGGLALLRRR